MQFTKEQLIKRLEEQDSAARYALSFVQDSEILRDIEMDLRITEIALASLEADSDSNSHPAHGPLSDYRLRRIREILGKAATQRDGGNIGYAMSDAVKAIDELLEVRTAEPDYIRYDCGCCGWETIEDWRDNDVCPKCNHKPMGKTELFIAPPAPVEPLTDEQIDDVLDSRGNILYVIADKRERLRMFAREILRAAMGDKS
ncbi:TPA: hypothetical protein KE767_003212 [Citrobacter koseri]|nr:hypothetical protein [Citrobacter koseri]